MRYPIALYFCCAGFAQEFRGTLPGRITDASSAVVPGAAVTVVHIETNAAIATKSNEQGNYRIPFLPPGDYRAVVEHTGFKKIERGGIRISLGSDTTLDFGLEVGTPTESVTVTGAAPLVNTSNADLGVVIDREYIQSLPVILTRNAIDRVMLSAGVTGNTGACTGNAQSEIAIMGGGSQKSSRAAPGRHVSLPENQKVRRALIWTLRPPPPDSISPKVEAFDMFVPGLP